MSNKGKQVEFRLSASDSRIVEDQRLVFGWASVVETTDGVEVVDLHDHIIEELELESAVYKFMNYGATASEMHREWYAGYVVESCVFTREKMEKMGIPAGTLPVGWWVGIKIHDPAVFEKVKNGQYKMLSIAGTAILEDDSNSVE